MKFPFKAYKLIQYDTVTNVAVPREEITCKSCGNPSGIFSPTLRYKPKKGRAREIKEYEVIGENETDYFVNMDGGDFGSDWIEPINKDDLYLEKPDFNRYGFSPALVEYLAARYLDIDDLMDSIHEDEGLAAFDENIVETINRTGG